MKTYSSMLLIATAALLVTGCASRPPAAKSGVELQAYQAREFETTKRAAFSATMSVFQDLGFIIDDGDFDTGLITATGPTSRHDLRRATAFVEKMPSGLVRIRLNFVDNSVAAPGTPQQSRPVQEPALYQATFEQIDKAIFVRSATT